MTSPKLPAAAFALAGLLALAGLVPAARAARPVAAATATADTLHVTLDQAIARALESGTGMQMARANVGVAEGRVKEALAEALPQITGTASYNRKFDSIFRGLENSG